MARRVSVSWMEKSKEDQVVELDFSQVLADAKQLTEWDELVKQEEMAENQHLIDVLAKINNLIDWNLWKNDIKKIFQSFWKNFRDNLQTNLTLEQAQNFRDVVEYLINNTNFDDKEIEQQMNNLYTVLSTFIEPVIPTEEMISFDDVITNDEWQDQSAWNLDDTLKEDKEIEEKNKEIEEEKEEIVEEKEEIEEEKEEIVEEKEEIEEEKEEIVEEKKEIEEGKEEIVEGKEEIEEENKEIEEENEEIEEENKEITEENKENIEENKEIEEKNKEIEEEKNDDISDKTEESITLKPNIDTNNIQEDLINLISNKNFPWKKFIQNIIYEKNQIKKSNNLKLLQLALVPYYKWEIDWEMSLDISKAIEKYITKNLNKDWEKILKSNDSNIIRCGSDWKILNEINWLNTVIKKIDNKDLWHAYFIDYPDFEYTIEKGTKITTTINDYNYFYDIFTNTLQRQTWNDTMQDVEDEDLLKKYFKIIAIVINK